jgi:hypothetical protein
MFAEHRFTDSLVYGFDSEPRYLSFSVTAYWLGVMYQRFSPSGLKLALFALARRS